MTTKESNGSPPDPESAALRTELIRVVDEVEAFAAGGGWNTQRQIFALVRTEELLAHEPGLIGHIGSSDPDAPAGSLPMLTPVEQGEMPGESIADALATIVWPDDVVGCVLVVEIIAESASGDAEGRLAIGVLRDLPEGACTLRWRHAPDGPLVRGPDLAPDLMAALRGTLE